jgi:hypothetical protein
VALRRVISTWAVAATALVVATGLGTASASPSAPAVPAVPVQEGDATITVEQAHPARTTVHYFVSLEAGGEAVDGATIVATPIDSGGAEGTPVTLTGDGGGIYQGSVTLAEEGDWTVEFASTDPSASLSHDQSMPAEVFVADGSEEDSSPVFPVLFAAAFLVTLAGMGVWALIDRRRADRATAEGDAPGDPVEAPGPDAV